MNYRKVIAFFFTATLGIISYGQQNNLTASSEGKKSRELKDLEFIDIGNVTKRGVATVNQSEIIAQAYGSDIWGKHDECLFGYKKIRGNFDVAVRVSSLSAAHKYTKAGIMARTDLSDSSQHVYYQLFPDNSQRNKNNGGCEFQYRVQKGADMKAIYPDMNTAGNKFNVNYPDTWIRLIRTGDVFESYISSDNRIWNLYSSFTLKMPSVLFVGLAVTSHNKNESARAVFESFNRKK
jgi:regulation of enolase protein 1 (concanavalin A-like superfamily)